MKKYLAFYETEWPANIAELTAVENKPFVGYLKGQGVSFTVVPKPQPNNEIWYTSRNGNVVIPNDTRGFGVKIVSNTYKDGKGVITFDGDVTSIGNYAFRDCSGLTSITYEGTQAQWNAITKGYRWNLNVPATYIQCTDGQVTL